MFVTDAQKCIEEITDRGHLPFIVGGTGLYVDSLLNNIRFNEEIRDEKLTNQLQKECDKKGVDYLLDRLAQFDAASADRLKSGRNAKRIIRAIEFYQTTGLTITEQINNSKTEPSPYHAVKIGVNYRDRQKLYDRINLRVDRMLQQGLIEETREVLSSPLSFTSAKAIGYKELAPYINGELSLDECVEKLKRETRRYAKRQLTWFRRDQDIKWLYADEYNSFQELYNTALQMIDEGLVYG